MIKKQEKQTSIYSYYVFMIIPMICVAIILGIGYRVLHKSGELNPAPIIAEKIIAKDGLYGTALYNMTFQFKKNLALQSKPDIVALGSSRVMQFHASSFNQNFINLGGISGVEEARIMYEAITAEGHYPKHLLFGIDYWWLRPDYLEPALQPDNHRFVSEPDVTLHHLVKPYVWLIEDKFSLKELINSLLSNTKHIGMSAIIRDDGFDKHGSYYYASFARAQIVNPDIKFAQSLARMDIGTKIYYPAPKMDPEKWQKLHELIQQIEKDGVKVTLMMAPMAPVIIEKMQEKKAHFGYIWDLMASLDALGVPFFNFHDAQKDLDTDACEFVDAHHGGSVLYRRMLRHMGQGDPTFASYLNIDEINDVIANHNGMAAYPLTGEIDFLEIGCDKKTP